MASAAATICSGSQPTDDSELPRRLITLRHLDWETVFFGARMGALVSTGTSRTGELHFQANELADELTTMLRMATLSGYRHVSCRVGAEDLPLIWAAERAGLRLMDVAVDLKFRLSSTPPPRRGERAVRHGVPDDVPAMRAMTVGAFGLTRFAVDPFFTSEQVGRFYQTWATNLFAGLADVVLLTDIDGESAGFVSCQLGEGLQGRIPLVATAARYQRRGVARDLLSAALGWFGEAGCTIAYVKTQASNYAAIALYEQAGFTLTRTELTFTTTLN